jgi:tetratricopeptide (TPR) repeat protein
LGAAAFPAAVDTAYAPPEALTSRIMAGIMAEDYNPILFLLDSLERAQPADPVPWFFEAVVQEMRMVDYERADRAARFDTVCAAGFRRLEPLRMQSPGNPWLLYYEGTLHIIRGGHQVRFAKYLDASQDIRQGISLLSEAEEKPGAPPDAGMFPAILTFAREEIGQYFSRIKFWQDESAPQSKGIQKLEQISRTARFSGELAKMLLVNFYSRDQRFPLAQTLIQELSERYPHNRAVLWLWAKACVEQKKWDIAVVVYDQLEEEIARIPGKSLYNMASLYTQAATAYFSLNRLAASSEACREAEACIKKDPVNDPRFQTLEAEIRKLKQRLAREKKP